jgi:ssDNA-binding Zn-finger/Zn-ribbon topoisomerase 1
MTAPLCPACEAPMDELSVSQGAVWVCSQRPDCKGRRSGRKLYKTAAPAPVASAEELCTEQA